MNNVKETADDIDLLQHFGSSGVLILILAPIYAQSLSRGVRMIAVTEVKQKLIEAGFQAHEREIVKISRELGFSLIYPHNKSHILVESEGKIVEISTRAGFTEDFYTGIAFENA